MKSLNDYVEICHCFGFSIIVFILNSKSINFLKSLNSYIKNRHCFCFFDIYIDIQSQGFQIDLLDLNNRLA